MIDSHLTETRTGCRCAAVHAGRYYEIHLQGELDPSWSRWFDDMKITNTPDGQAILEGLLPDQAALYGVLIKVQNLGLCLLSLSCRSISANGS